MLTTVIAFSKALRVKISLNSSPVSVQLDQSNGTFPLRLDIPSEQNLHIISRPTTLLFLLCRTNN